jgi:hypothetical protein
MRQDDAAARGRRGEDIDRADHIRPRSQRRLIQKCAR